MSTINIYDLQPTSPELFAESKKLVEVTDSEARKTAGGIFFEPFVIQTDRWIVTFCPDGTISHGSSPYCPRRL
ncbi:hypothetical protein BJP36_14130 [Moorena producens JHB]|uniref:Uncharacterized protein n=1 Tax=Moorena producens (strain JHB) TaxID=1454205 RepID=A0A1D9FZX6_MOOP1|nr:hypothetical protein [Moorena producens]AOY80881.1 hypothetical protein BJP36_14130 [Moorena producens JHB]